MTSFSNRGPTPQSLAGIDVTAIGAFGTGDLALNEVLWGAVAVANFSGTSMATPVTAGNLALMYDAWHERTGEWPTAEQARNLLMASAHDQNNDVFVQGAGLVNADTGTDIAAGLAGVRTTPSDWSVGDYRGTEYPAFVHIIGPGGSDTQEFTIHDDRASGSPVDVEVSADEFTQSGSTDYSFTTLDASQSHGAFPIPDYVIRIDGDIPAGTDLISVRMARPYDQFDPELSLDAPFNFFELDIEDWTDRNGDGDFWDDANGNGKVDVGETDTGENNGVNYDGNVGPTQETRMHDPLDRMTDGLLISLYHFGQTAEVPTTDFDLIVEYWDRTDWGWLTLGAAPGPIAAGGSATFEATVDVPADAPLGVYEGAIRVASGDHVQTIPVTVDGRRRRTGHRVRRHAVAGRPLRQRAGRQPDERVLAARDGRLAVLRVRRRGRLAAVGRHELHGRLDRVGRRRLRHRHGRPRADRGRLQRRTTRLRYGPYALDIVGRSQNTLVGFSGYWTFQTASGGAAEMIAAPIRDGLHEVLLHHVIGDVPALDEATLDEPFSGSVGVVHRRPEQHRGRPGRLAGRCHDLVRDRPERPYGRWVRPERAGHDARDRAPGRPERPIDGVVLDDRGDLTRRAARGDASANSDDESDIDLYVYDPDGNLVGASFTPTDDERVEIFFPVDGTYRIDVHGFAVLDGSDDFDLTINAVQGTDVTVTGLASSIPAGGSDTFEVAWSVAGKPAGVYQGFVMLGPTGAPGLFRIPLEITVPEAP